MTQPQFAAWRAAAARRRRYQFEVKARALLIALYVIRWQFCMVSLALRRRNKRRQDFVQRICAPILAKCVGSGLQVYTDSKPPLLRRDCPAQVCLCHGWSSSSGGSGGDTHY
jgi:hypothetical protein